MCEPARVIKHLNTVSPLHLARRAPVSQESGRCGRTGGQPTWGVFAATEGLSCAHVLCPHTAWTGGGGESTPRWAHSYQICSSRSKAASATFTCGHRLPWGMGQEGWPPSVPHQAYIIQAVRGQPWAGAGGDSTRTFRAPCRPVSGRRVSRAARLAPVQEAPRPGATEGRRVRKPSGAQRGEGRLGRPGLLLSCDPPNLPDQSLY